MRDDPRMALRILTYTSLLYEELVRNGAVDADEALPPVLPVVPYNALVSQETRDGHP